MVRSSVLDCTATFQQWGRGELMCWFMSDASGIRLTGDVVIVGVGPISNVVDGK